MNKICTSINQSKKLLELGIDVKTADMVYCVELYKEGWKYSNEAYPIDGTLEGDDIPAWSLSALMELMNRNCYNVSLNCHGAEWNVKFDDSENYKAFTKDYSVDAAFEMIVWLKENGKI